MNTDMAVGIGLCFAFSWLAFCMARASQRRVEAEHPSLFSNQSVTASKPDRPDRS